VIHCSAAQADLIEKLVDEHKIVADRLLRAAPGCNVARVTMAAPRRMAHGLLRTRQNASVAGKDARARACICLARGARARATHLGEIPKVVFQDFDDLVQELEGERGLRVALGDGDRVPAERGRKGRRSAQGCHGEGAKLGFWNEANHVPYASCL
jgi:hypothetical protein